MPASLFDDADGCHGDSPPAQRHSSTSVAAADAIVPVAGRLRLRVLGHLAERGEYGATDEEGMAALDMPASTYRPRRIECVSAGRVVDSGKTRKTKSNRSAVVWVCAEYAPQPAAEETPVARILRPPARR